jgi:putative restriction endonuclease
MNYFHQLIARLPKKHQEALIWYSNHAGDEVAWPEPLLSPEGLNYLATRAKGIYKPKWSDYALSIRQSLVSPYPDKAPIIRDDGTWFYSYYQQNIDPLARDQEYANRALMKCYE